MRITSKMQRSARVTTRKAQDSHLKRNERQRRPNREQHTNRQQSTTATTANLKRARKQRRSTKRKRKTASMAPVNTSKQNTKHTKHPYSSSELKTKLVNMVPARHTGGVGTNSSSYSELNSSSKARPARGSLLSSAMPSSWATAVSRTAARACHAMS